MRHPDQTDNAERDAADRGDHTDGRNLADHFCPKENIPEEVAREHSMQIIFTDDEWRRDKKISQYFTGNPTEFPVKRYELQRAAALCLFSVMIRVFGRCRTHRGTMSDSFA